jgi:hypothetical protein
MPRLQFSTILSNAKAIANVTSQDSLIKQGIQMGLDRLTDKDLPYLMSDGVITTVAPYQTGTITVTNNSKTVTGSGTTFTSAMVGRKIRVHGENAYYRIGAYVSATELTLEVVYQGDTDSALTYSIFKDEYRLPADLDVYKVLRQIENNRTIIDLEQTAFDLYEPSPIATGSPRFSILTGSKLDTYSTGTISGTVNASVITGLGTAFSSLDGLSRGSRITVGTVVYTVKTVDSDTQLTIYELISSTFTGSAYAISLDNYIIQLFYIPDQIENIYFKYQRIPFPLINDQDIPDLPEKYHHILITAGLIWAWAVKDKAESLVQTKLFEQQRQEMWTRIGNPSSNRVYSRVSQDDMARMDFTTSLPSSYGFPIPR